MAKKNNKIIINNLIIIDDKKLDYVKPGTFGTQKEKYENLIWKLNNDSIIDIDNFHFICSSLANGDEKVHYFDFDSQVKSIQNDEGIINVVNSIRKIIDAIGTNAETLILIDKELTSDVNCGEKASKVSKLLVDKLREETNCKVIYYTGAPSVDTEVLAISWNNLPNFCRRIIEKISK
jgi:hypothetical protein